MKNLGISVYVKNSATAVLFYQKVFNLELGYHVKNPDGSFYHSELYRDGVELLSVVESPRGSVPTYTVQLAFTFDTETELRRAFDLLKEGGTIDMNVCTLPWSPCAASVVDKFGVFWYLTMPQHQPGPDFDPSIPLN